MKKILCCFLNPLFLLLCTIIPLNTYAVDDYEMPKNSGGTPTVTVIGTRGGGGGGGGVGPILGGGGGGRGAGGGGAGPGMSEGQEAKAETKRRQECEKAASDAGAACASGYNQLTTICNIYTNALAGFGVRRLLEKFALTLPAGTTATVTTISMGATFVGGPCSGLVSKAMEYCAQGAGKMKAECK